MTPYVPCARRTFVGRVRHVEGREDYGGANGGLLALGEEGVLSQAYFVVRPGNAFF